MIYYHSALEILRELGRKAEFDRFEKLDIESAIGRVLAKEVVSPEAVPLFDNSAMDGFAVWSGSTQSATLKCPVRIEVNQMVSAGHCGQISGNPGAVEIMTGAPIPQIFDAVVKVEDVKVWKDERGKTLAVELSNPVNIKQHVRKKGSDFAVGQRVCARGERMMPEHLLALASLGVTECEVMARPRVAFISTGRELVPFSMRNLEPGMIRNSTSPYVKEAVRWMGAGAGVDFHYFGTIADDPNEFQNLIRKLTSNESVRFDVILTTGAVSMGVHDFIKESLVELGAEICFHKVAIRPGKPLLVARFKNGPIFFGLPGNPVSTSVGLRFFVEPYLRALLGLSPESGIKAQLFESIAKPEGLRCFFKSKLFIDDSGARAQVLPGQESYRVSSLLKANAWVVLGEEGERMEKEMGVEVFSLYPTYDFTGELEPMETGSPRCC